MVLLWAGALGAATASTVVASTMARGFVGAQSCKLCHREIYDSWRRTPHASTGTVEIDASARCSTCHATDLVTRRRGVQCEACHGPGEDYSPAEVMIDPEKAAMAGLVRPDEGTCRRCHDNDEPNHRSELELPSDAEWARWVHVRPSRARAVPQP